MYNFFKNKFSKNSFKNKKGQKDQQKDQQKNLVIGEMKYFLSKELKINSFDIIDSTNPNELLIKIQINGYTIVIDNIKSNIYNEDTKKEIIKKLYHYYLNNEHCYDIKYYIKNYLNTKHNNYYILDKEKSDLFEFMDRNIIFISRENTEIRGKYNMIEGFKINLENNIKIIFKKCHFDQEYFDQKFGIVEIYYKDDMMINFTIETSNNHKSGTPMYLILSDPYFRYEKSKHDLHKTVDYFFKIIKPYKEKFEKEQKEQKLKLDKKFEEFYNKIK